MNFRPNTDAGTVVIEAGGEQVEKTPEEAVAMAFDLVETIEESPDATHVSMEVDGLSVETKTTEEVLDLLNDLAQTAQSVSVYEEVEEQ